VRLAPPLLASADALQDDHRKLPCRLLLILAESRHQGHMLREEPLVFLPLRNGSASLELLATQFYRYDRVGKQVMVPVRVGWRASLGGNDDKVVAIRRRRQRSDAGLPTFRAGGGQQKQIASVRHIAAVSAKCIDHRLIVVAETAHNVLFA